MLPTSPSTSMSRLDVDLVPGRPPLLRAAGAPAGWAEEHREAVLAVVA